VFNSFLIRQRAINAPKIVLKLAENVSPKNFAESFRLQSDIIRLLNTAVVY
jgi:hypothetical protein